jgi:hypothetical protein
MKSLMREREREKKREEIGFMHALVSMIND